MQVSIIFRDCDDGTDELDCPTTTTTPATTTTLPTQGDPCLPSEWQCRSGEPSCVSVSQLCDRQRDCQDGSDELDCSYCRDFEFTCNSGQCIDSWKQCDGKTDCPDRLTYKLLSVNNVTTVTDLMKIQHNVEHVD